ncbi:MAG: putative transposase [Candidatus Kentron sp. G]|nr:MAG: putative transposase [Candidatus Kentron sp. G]VFN07687.1 MAG: putative transposase [Candidatus Kentron sp. G]
MGHNLTFAYTSLVTEKRRPLFDDESNIDTLGEAFRAVRRKRPFRMDAVVVLPDHLHSLWTLPLDDSDFSTRWRLIETWFTKHCREELRTPPNAARRNTDYARSKATFWYCINLKCGEKISLYFSRS